MTDKKKIKELVRELLKEDMFLVEIDVSASNVIRVYIDSFKGLTIEDCALFHNQLEQKLDRSNEDFELQVSSPGLSESFRVREQFLKNRGRCVEVLTNEGEKVTGVLKSAGDDNFIIVYSGKEKVEGQKKKQPVVKEFAFDYNKIKSVKVVVTFKKPTRDGKY
ncbi:MAG: ribosome assembly cofactor RimP [Bacteroidales bacterium]|nr:ribosome assembly cofactor RimP [Bacteroidales bacterium]